jgi:hypothetical protein
VGPPVARGGVEVAHPFAPNFDRTTRTQPDADLVLASGGEAHFSFRSDHVVAQLDEQPESTGHAPPDLHLPELSLPIERKDA